MAAAHGRRASDHGERCADAPGREPVHPLDEATVMHRRSPEARRCLCSDERSNRRLPDDMHARHHGRFLAGARSGCRAAPDHVPPRSELPKSDNRPSHKALLRATKDAAHRSMPISARDRPEISPGQAIPVRRFIHATWPERIRSWGPHPGARPDDSGSWTYRRPELAP